MEKSDIIVTFRFIEELPTASFGFSYALTLLAHMHVQY